MPCFWPAPFVRDASPVCWRIIAFITSTQDAEWGNPQGSSLLLALDRLLPFIVFLAFFGPLAIYRAEVQVGANRIRARNPTDKPLGNRSATPSAIRAVAPRVKIVCGVHSPSSVSRRISLRLVGAVGFSRLVVDHPSWLPFRAPPRSLLPSDAEFHRIPP